MKKVISMILVLVLVLSMGITAFAAEVPEGESQSIKATYSVADSKAVYKVDIAWGGMVFNYASGMENVWNPETLKFEIAQKGEPSWTPAEEGGDTVTVTNHSNAPVGIKIAYTKAENGVEGTLENGSFTLDSADNGVDGAAGTPTANSAKLSLSTENIPESFTDGSANVTLGTITVTIKQNDTLVSSEAELLAALEKGGNIMLTGDITVSDEYWGGYEITKNTTIDLNGHTITGVYVFTPNPENAGVVLTISGNGTIKATDPDNDMPVDVWGTLNLLGGTIEGYTNIFGTINMSGGWVDQLNTDKLNSDDDTSHITGGYVRHLNCWGGIVTISGGHVEALGIKYGTIIISGGTFGFDPTAYLAEGYTATEADGIWTVTSN